MERFSLKQLVELSQQKVHFLTGDHQPVAEASQTDASNPSASKKNVQADDDCDSADNAKFQKACILTHGSTSVLSEVSVDGISPSTVKPLAIRLSSLQGSDEFEIDTDTTQTETTVVVTETPMTTEKSKRRCKPNNSEISGPKQSETSLNTMEEQPSFWSIWFMALCVYGYLILPLPSTLQIFVVSFVSGALLAAAALCIVAPKSRRASCNVPAMFYCHADTACIAESVWDFSKPIKGWLNEIDAYDPDTYHVNNTHSVYVTLDGSTMRLQTPQKSLSRRAVFGEGNVPLSNVIKQRLFDVTDAKVWLQPSDLSKKRVWSKKYPICVEIPHTKAKPFKSSLPDPLNSAPVSTSTPQNTVIYLFGRSNHQKELWFYRFQRCINIAVHNSKKNESVSSCTASDDWGLLAQPSEQNGSTYIASTLINVDAINENPHKAFEDYVVHISRLFPELKVSGKVECGTNTSAGEFKEPRPEVAWLNVVIGRIMFDFFRQPEWAKWLSNKIQKKLDKIKLPYFIEELKLDEINLGSTAPFVHYVSQPKLDGKGAWCFMDITYSGCLQMTFKTKIALTKVGKNDASLIYKVDRSSKTCAVVDDSDVEDSAESSSEDESAVSRVLGQVQNVVHSWDGRLGLKDSPKVPSGQTSQSVSGAKPVGQGSSKRWLRLVDSITKSKYFQKATENEFIRKKLESVSNTPVSLSVELVELKGTLALNIPPPPTDRVWYGFCRPPHMVLKAQPQYGERIVKMVHITDWIENKLQEEFMKVLVMPNMDDIPIPMMFSNR